MDAIKTRLLSRIDAMWSRYEATGDERYMRLALEADRVYLHACNRDD